MITAPKLYLSLGLTLSLTILILLKLGGLQFPNEAGLYSKPASGAEFKSGTSLKYLGENASKSERQIRKVALSDIQSLGYEISASKETEYGATGDVKVVTPEGEIITAEALVLSTSGNKFHLIGNHTTRQKMSG